jgi:hypothetical protein
MAMAAKISGENTAAARRNGGITGNEIFAYETAKSESKAGESSNGGGCG